MKYAASVIILIIVSVILLRPEPLVVVGELDSLVEPTQAIVFQLNRRTRESRRSVIVEPEHLFQASWAPDGRTVTLSPSQPWDYGHNYKVLICDEALVDFSVIPMPRVTVIAGGDVLLDKLPGEHIARYGPSYVFAGVSDLLRSADIAFANLENPASRRGQPVQKNFKFRSTPEALDALVHAGIDVVSFSNNHTHDYGTEAFLDTLEHLSERGIAYVGAGRNRSEALQPYITTVNGIDVAFLAFMQKSFLPKWSYSLWEATDENPGVIFLDEQLGRDDILATVRLARTRADVVLVSLHWGYEGTLAPQPWQRALGKEVIDAGATAILGHHPHLPFGVELHNGKPIIYSLGNFLFHPFDPEARESFVALLDIGLDNNVTLKLHPILIHNGSVTLLQGDSAVQLIETVIKRSEALGTSLVRTGDYIEIQGVH